MPSVAARKLSFREWRELSENDEIYENFVLPMQGRLTRHLKHRISDWPDYCTMQQRLEFRLGKPDAIKRQAIIDDMLRKNQALDELDEYMEERAVSQDEAMAALEAIRSGNFDMTNVLKFPHGAHKLMPPFKPISPNDNTKPFTVPPPIRPSDSKQTEPEPQIAPRRFDASSLAGKEVPERSWWMSGLIPHRNVTLVYGDGGTGKSLLILQAAVAARVNRQFLGRMVKQGPVEFITAEDEEEEMHRRLVDICRETGCKLDDLAGLNITSLAEAEALMAVPENNRSNVLATTALYDELEKTIAESKPALVVLDTLADVFGGNEVVRSQARQFIGMLRHLAIAYDCAIVLLAHPSLAGINSGTGTSGSTGWNNSVRSRLYFSRDINRSTGEEQDPDARVLTVGKANYGRVGTTINVRWQRGAFVFDGAPDVGPDAWTQERKAEEKFLELLDWHTNNNVPVSMMPRAGNYAPKMFMNKIKRREFNAGQFVGAMQRLIDANRIENVPYGRPSNQSFRLQRTMKAPS